MEAEEGQAGSFDGAAGVVALLECCEGEGQVGAGQGNGLGGFEQGVPGGGQVRDQCGTVAGRWRVALGQGSDPVVLDLGAVVETLQQGGVGLLPRR